jgi:hypothetical protein
VIAVQAQSGSNRRLGQDMEKTAPEPTADYIAIYQEAVKAFNAGNLDDAEQQVELVLGKYPHYKPASNLQSRIVLARRNDTSVVLKRKLEAIVIPRVNFRDALVENALDFLRDETRRLDRDKKGVNIVPNLPEETKKRKVTLDLVDVSAAELLKYISEVGGFRYRVERSAVIIYSDEPARPAAAPTASSEPSPSLLPVIPNAPQ